MGWGGSSSRGSSSREVGIKEQVPGDAATREPKGQAGKGRGQAACSPCCLPLQPLLPHCSDEGGMTLRQPPVIRFSPPYYMSPSLMFPTTLYGPSAPLPAAPRAPLLNPSHHTVYPPPPCSPPLHIPPTCSMNHAGPIWSYCSSLPGLYLNPGQGLSPSPSPC